MGADGDYLDSELSAVIDRARYVLAYTKATRNMQKARKVSSMLSTANMPVISATYMQRRV